MTTEAPPPLAIDGSQLIAQVRRGDPSAIERAYKATFGHELGRLVLAHHLADCGVGNTLGPDPESLAYRAGQHDGALKLAAQAGFDQAALAVAVLTDQLEDRADEISDFGAVYTPPDDDGF